MEDLKNIIESLIFVSKEPISVNQIRKILPDISTREIQQSLDDLIEDYGNKKGGFYLREIAGGYQFRSSPEYSKWISLLIQPNPVRLSKPALETLAIIAYRQPIIRSDIEHIRGVESGGIIRMLMERKLIRALGRKDIPGRPLIYATTKQFLELFDLRDLKDLPSLKEIEEFGKQSQAVFEENLYESEKEPDTDQTDSFESETEGVMEVENDLDSEELPEAMIQNNSHPDSDNENKPEEFPSEKS
ncbi:MAG: SMC-Scp complex subunit ScpB [Desulfobacterales bacterium]